MFHSSEAAATSHFCYDPPAQTCPLKICAIAETYPAAHIHNTQWQVLQVSPHTLSQHFQMGSHKKNVWVFPVSCCSCRPFCFKIVPILVISGTDTTCSSTAVSSARSALLCCVLSQLLLITRITSELLPKSCLLSVAKHPEMSLQSVIQHKYFNTNVLNDRTTTTETVSRVRATPWNWAHKQGQRAARPLPLPIDGCQLPNWMNRFS